MKELNREQIVQQLMLARALLRARDKLQDDRTVYEEVRSSAASILTSAYVLLGDRADLRLRRMRTATGNRDVSTLLEVMAPFLSSDATLSEFGKLPWGVIERAFSQTEHGCPIAFAEFHKEYQKELENAAAKGSRLSHPVPTIPPNAHRL